MHIGARGVTRPATTEMWNAISDLVAIYTASRVLDRLHFSSIPFKSSFSHVGNSSNL
jgi:hypothetical protein